MKIIFLAYWFSIKTFALFSIDFASPAPQKNSFVPLLNNSFNHKSHFSKIDLQETLKTMNKSRHNNVKKEKFLTSTSLYENKNGHTVKTQNFSTVKSVFHIFQIKTERMKKPHVNKVNEQFLYSNQPLFRKIYTFPQTVDYRAEKRGLYFGTFYPMLYHRNNFNDYTRSFYHPYFHKNYDIRNVNKHFLNKRQHLDKYVIGNHVYYPEKKLSPFYPQEKVLYSKSLPSFLLQVTTDNTIQPYAIIDEVRTDEKSVYETSTYKTENTSEYLQTEVLTESTTMVDATNENSLFKVSQEESKEERRTKYQQNLDEKRILNVPKHEDFINESTEKLKGNNIFHSNHERSEPSDSLNISKSNSLNVSNRMYYEKMPSNLNVSWFVYVSCSRERCQFTNSTNETEIMNEGWILHNCTSYDCREMYPETERIQKFIGLMLLVFSICILKIVAFLLVFYYCRSIKLSKSESDERERLLSDDDGTDLPSKKEKLDRDDMKRENPETGRPKHTGSMEFLDTQLKENRHTSQEKSGKSDSGLLPKEVSKINSKIWIPPVQKVLPCFIAASQAGPGDVFTSKECSQKKVVTNIPNELKSKRKACYTSPELENWIICNKTNNSRKEADNLEETCSINVPNIKEQSSEEGELLLMDLDEEITTDSSRSSNYANKPSSWEVLLEDECKGFINFDLSDDENSRK